jgi:hypothetical protein
MTPRQSKPAARLAIARYVTENRLSLPGFSTMQRLQFQFAVPPDYTPGVGKTARNFEHPSLHHPSVLGRRLDACVKPRLLRRFIFLANTGA